MTHGFNATAASVMRPTGRDRHSEPLLRTVYTGIPLRLDKTNRVVRTRDGDERVVDAQAWLSAHHKLEPGDRLLLSDSTSWEVMDVSKEALDVLGNVDHRVYSLVKRSWA